MPLVYWEGLQRWHIYHGVICQIVAEESLVCRRFIEEGEACCSLYMEGWTDFPDSCTTELPMSLPIETLLHSDYTLGCWMACLGSCLIRFSETSLSAT